MLFLLNFISASLLGVLLLAPVKRVFHQLGTRVLELTTVGGFGIAVTSLAALLISERTRLFGWMELNYRPAIVVALVSEAAATLSLGLLFLLLRRGRRERSISSELIEYAQARPRAT
jgi:nucleoside recognition membrane protein YjiH